MSRYTGPSCKICRRNKVKLFLKGARCATAKCAIEKRNTPPGPPAKMPKKLSDYGIRMREKQKMRFYYGVHEAQIRRYFSEALRSKENTGHELIAIFERRLDNVVFRLGLCDSRHQSRQMVLHGHIRVNGRRVSIPSFLVRPNDVVTITKGSEEWFAKAVQVIGEKNIPTWLSYNKAENNFCILHTPKRDEVDIPVQEHLIVEYYSR
jgi:small subunit ribosomal protein S4